MNPRTSCYSALSSREVLRRRRAIQENKTWSGKNLWLYIIEGWTFFLEYQCRSEECVLYSYELFLWTSLPSWDLLPLFMSYSASFSWDMQHISSIVAHYYTYEILVSHFLSSLFSCRLLICMVLLSQTRSPRVGGLAKQHRMAVEASKVRNLESSLLFLQQEHANTLKCLHEEIKTLQKRNSGLYLLIKTSYYCDSLKSGWIMVCACTSSQMSCDCPQ